MSWTDARRPVPRLWISIHTLCVMIAKEQGFFLKAKKPQIVVVVLLFYVHGKHLRSCRDGPLT